MLNIFIYIVCLIILIGISYIVLIIILSTFNPEFYNSDGSVNWLTPLWVISLISIFTIILFALFIGVLVECVA